MALVANLFKAYLAVKVFKGAMDSFNAFNSIIAPGGNMGISRSRMPQIASDRLGEYQRFLSQRGITLRLTKVATAELRLTQNEYNKDKVIKLMDKYRKSGAKIDPPIASSDGFIVDGSHRFIAKHNINPQGDMWVLKANVKVKEILDASRSFPGVTYRSVSGAEVAA